MKSGTRRKRPSKFPSHYRPLYRDLDVFRLKSVLSKLPASFIHFELASLTGSNHPHAQTNRYMFTITDAVENRGTAGGFAPPLRVNTASRQA